MTAPTAAIVTIGNFDGVHLGHQRLLGAAVERAHALGLRSLAITFDPHPEQVLFPERQFRFLSSPDERTEYLRATGIDAVWVMPFTRDLAHLEPAEFMQLVAERQPLAELWVGSDFALGRGRQGSIAVLSELGGQHGWSLHVVPPYRLAGQVVSSTAIRTLLVAGAVRGAADLLGRPYSVRGELRQNELIADPQRALPRPGLYETELHVNGQPEHLQARVSPDSPRVGLASHCTAHRAELRFLRRAEAE